jgi:hypothetical protein
MNHKRYFSDFIKLFAPQEEEYKWREIARLIPFAVFIIIVAWLVA